MNYARATKSAAEDLQYMFRSDVASVIKASKILEDDFPRAIYKRTKANGAKVYKAPSAVIAGRYYMLVKDGKILAAGPPSEAHDLPPSYHRYQPKPGEQGPSWWMRQPGDLDEAPTTETQPVNLERRARVLPLIAEVRDLAEEAGWDARQIGSFIHDGRTWGSREVRRLLNSNMARGEVPMPEKVREGLQAAANELRRVLGKPRPAHRPKDGAEERLPMSGRLPASLLQWTRANGGWTLVEQLLEEERARRTR